MKKNPIVLFLAGLLSFGIAGCTVPGVTPISSEPLPSESSLPSQESSEPAPSSSSATEEYVWGYQVDKEDEVHEDQVDFATGKVTNDVSGKAVEVTTLPNLVDYVSTAGLTLNLDYAGHDFWTEGIGKVTLKTSIDGDTAHFYPVVTTTSSTAIRSEEHTSELQSQ